MWFSYISFEDDDVSFTTEKQQHTTHIFFHCDYTSSFLGIFIEKN